MPVSPANYVRENDPELLKAIQNLTATVKDVSHELGALKLRLGEQGSRRHQEKEHANIPHHRCMELSL